jgi:surface protein
MLLGSLSTAAQGEWMTIDAGKKMTIEGVVTQSRRNSNQMVTKFKVLTSDELNGEYTYVANGGVFEGNTIRDEQVMVEFPEPVEARFVRLEVVAWNEYCAMRAALVYKPKDGERFVFNPEENARTYSSVHGNQKPGTGHARSTLNSDQAWSAGGRNPGEWMTMDSGAVQTIAGVAVQSRRNSDQMIRTFKVLVSNASSTDFTYVDDGRLFVGNSVREVVENVKFADPVSARYVRIEVQTYNQYPSMRAGILIRQGPCPPPKKRVIPDPDTIIGMNPPDEARIMSSSYHNDKSGYRYNTGMLDSNQGWLSASNDNKQFYIMDAGHVMSIMGVVLQNRKNQDQYVEIYKVSVSNELRGPYMEVDNGAAFVGNTKRSDEKAEALFMEPVTARYVRIEPVAYRGHTAMRCGLKVIKDSIVEDLPALPESKLLNPPDAARSASSSLHNDKSGYRYFTSMLDSREGWLAGRNAPGEYLTIDAGEVRPISAVVTQRRRGHNEMVTKFKVLTSENADGPFTYVADGATYIGTTYLEGEEKGEAVFPEPVSARFVRIEVVSFTRRVTLRAGLKYMLKPTSAADAVSSVGAAPFTSLEQLKAAVESCMSVGDKSGKECCSKHGADCGPAGKTDMPGWNVSQMTSLESLFGWPSGWGNFQEDLSAWDTSSVTNIASLFRSSSYNPGPKVDAWDVSKVTNMDYAFYKSRFNQPLSGWDVRNVQKAHELFTYNAVFAQDITMWDMPNIGDKGLHRTFDGSGAFTKAFVNCGNPSDAESIPECAGKEFPFSKGRNDGPPGAWTKRN